jgi:hypothetical protein
LYAQLLIALSFAIAAYQDVKDRAVNDLVWIPAILGAAYSLYWAFPSLELPAVKIALVGGIALAFTFLGGIGQADAIALVFIAADPYQLSPIFPLFGTAVAALVHIGYEYLVGNARGNLMIPMEKFLREQRWIPKAIVADGVRTEVSRDVNNAREEVQASSKAGASVEVSYGVPTVAYLGIGYVAYLAYLVIFNLPLFLALP